MLATNRSNGYRFVLNAWPLLLEVVHLLLIAQLYQKKPEVHRIVLRILDSVLFCPRDPGWAKYQDPDLGSGIWIRDEHPGHHPGYYYRKLRNNVWG